MKEIYPDRQNEDTPQEKQPYTRPELVKHGSVESVTQNVTIPSTSRPIDV